MRKRLVRAGGRVIRYDLSRVGNSEIVRASPGFKSACATSIGMDAYLMKVGSGDWGAEHRTRPLFIQQGVVLSDPIILRTGLGIRSETPLKYGKGQRSAGYYNVVQACVPRRV